MMDIGINYITELNEPYNKYDNIYKLLIENGYINTIKFPGKYCNYNTLECFLSLAKKTNAKIDIHGIPGMKPSAHCTEFIKNVDWEEWTKFLPKCKRMSTHMGLENKDNISNYKEGTFEKNIENLKHKMNCDSIGIENIPGGFEFDKETLSPEFISNSWKNVDFGVFDISHAKLAAKTLNMTYDEYLEKISNKEKVKILHISGNDDVTDKYINKPDKHVLINEIEIKDIIKTLSIFENLDLAVSEYAFNSKYTYEKELVIETITLFSIVKTRDVNISSNILKFLEENLQDDISNIQDIFIEVNKLLKNRGM